MVQVHYYLTAHFVGDIAHGSSSGTIVFRVEKDEMLKHFNEEKALVFFFEGSSIQVSLSKGQMNNIEPYNQMLHNSVCFSRKDAIESAPYYPDNEDIPRVLDYFNKHPEIPDEEYVSFDRESYEPIVRNRTKVSVADLSFSYISTLYKAAKIREMAENCQSQLKNFILKGEQLSLSLKKKFLKAIDSDSAKEDNKIVKSLLKQKWIEVLVDYHNSPVMNIIDFERTQVQSPEPGTLHLVIHPEEDFYFFISDDESSPPRSLSYEEWLSMVRDARSVRRHD